MQPQRSPSESGRELPVFQCHLAEKSIPRTLNSGHWVLSARLWVLWATLLWHTEHRAGSWVEIRVRQQRDRDDPLFGIRTETQLLLPTESGQLGGVFFYIVAVKRSRFSDILCTAYVA